MRGLSVTISLPAVTCLRSFTISRTFSRKRCVCFLAGLMMSFIFLPSLYLRTFCPRKSKPSVICVIFVFSWDNSRSRSLRKRSTRGLTSVSRSSFERPVTIKSSAYRMRFTLYLALWPFLSVVGGNRLRGSASSPSKAILAMTGDSGPPCGVPSSVGVRAFFSMNPAFSHFLRMAFSLGRWAKIHWGS